MAKVNDIREAEHWIATCKDTLDCFNVVWAPWVAHMTNPGEVSSSLDLAILELAELTLRSRVEGMP